MKRVLGLSIVGFVFLLTGLASAQQTDTTGQSLSTAPVGGGGTTNYIPIWTNSSTLGNSVIFQKNGNIGIGTKNPAANAKLDVNGSVHVDGAVAATSSLVAEQTLFAGINLEVLHALFVQGNITDPCGNTSANLIGNFPTNTVTNVTGATIGGGGSVFFNNGNRVTDSFGTVSGGGGNVAGNSSGTCDAAYAYATVGGGENNHASAAGATVAGGFNNTASGDSSTVAGGINNTTSGDHSTVAGGFRNTASGHSSTVAGGDNNTASGADSFAGGQVANANDYNSFVWCAPMEDHAPVWGRIPSRRQSTVPSTSSTAQTDQAATLSSGGGSWNCSSDRSLKDDITPIDSPSVLERVAQLPIT